MRIIKSCCENKVGSFGCVKLCHGRRLAANKATSSPPPEAEKNSERNKLVIISCGENLLTN